MGHVGIPIERPIMQLDTGATAWMLISSSLVLLMTVPGLALFYGGMSRTKSVLNMFMMSFGAFALVGVVYPLWGWSMTYGGRDIAGVFANPFSQFGLGGGFEGTRIDDFGVPAWVSVAFQMTFAIIAVALISGSLAERVKFSTWMAFTAIWVTLVYFPMAHMVWGGGLLSGDGPIARLIGVAPIDFAGGTVVHINAGVAGLVLALIIGKRPGFGLEAMRPHNLPFVMAGAALLLFGWFGFNAGSAFTANALAGMAWVNTAVAAAAASLAWMATEKLRDGSATSLGAASGIVAGLVAITPGAGALDPFGSILIGFIVGVACAHAVSLKLRFGFDDSLDVVGVHLVGGLIGTILIGLLALDGGLLHGGGFGLLIVQTLVALIALAFSGAVTALIALVLGATLGWRVAPQIESAGIDLGEHSESAYESAPALRLS
ncbi:MAG: ammonium transporter [Schaalia hyovaginalis]|uniref:ammonium transporter n=1 Tax=Schaalia hyovaginalis TaxID=29316 RepID=UPI0023F78D16|nr:ammonium transporter [Schaalia hyovaginalis]MCI7672492.1 ammonium transporter [Schaalia hyovaginalis]MDY5505432.1 ammonium transporter [Schaalia hyovaginalis]MDY6214592.1 ammonium transporter [Schaalia hyovaginalis]